MLHFGCDKKTSRPNLQIFLMAVVLIIECWIWKILKCPLATDLIFIVLSWTCLMVVCSTFHGLFMQYNYEIQIPLSFIPSFIDVFHCRNFTQMLSYSFPVFLRALCISTNGKQKCVESIKCVNFMQVISRKFSTI